MDKSRLIHAANIWWNQGVSVVPVRVMSKAPLIKWTRWMHERPPWPIVEMWFKTKYPCNIGIILRDGLSVIDFDDRLSYANWVLEMPHLKDTLTVNTSRGRHVYLSLLDYENTTFNFVGGEVKCNGVAIVPPSVHITGHRYVYVDEDARILGRSGIEDLGVRILGETGYKRTLQEGQNSGVVQKVKDNVSIDVFLGEHTVLHQNGKDSLIGLCPFHNDSTPSLQVFPSEGRCYCHAPHCRAHRKTDVIAAAAYLYNMSMREATLLLLEGL